MMSTLLFRQILSLFIMMGAGFTLVKTKLARSDDSRILSVISIYLIIPCTVIKAFQIELTPDVRNGFLIALASAVLIHVCLLLLDQVFKRVLKLDHVERASVIYSNAGNLIIPLVTALLGEEWIIYASAYICVQLVFLWTHAITLVSGERKIQIRKILTNVNLLSVFVGLALMLLHIRLPEIVMSAVGGIAGIIGPVCMIMIGMVLASVDFREVLTDAKVYLTTFLKMLVTPAIILLMLWASHLAGLVPEGRTILMISYMAAITPPAATITQMALLHRNRPDHASAINAMSTILCVGTMPLMIWLFELLI